MIFFWLQKILKLRNSVRKLQYYQADHSQNFDLHFESTTESTESEELRKKLDDSDEIQSSLNGESSRWSIGQNSLKSKGSMNFELEATNQGNDPKHVESIEEDVEIQAPIELITQIQSIHQNVKFACNQCDYQATTQRHLTTHIQSQHEGVKYACNQCDYHGSKDALRMHLKIKHI